MNRARKIKSHEKNVENKPAPMLPVGMESGWWAIIFECCTVLARPSAGRNINQQQIVPIVERRSLRCLGSVGACGIGVPTRNHQHAAFKWCLFFLRCHEREQVRFGRRLDFFCFELTPEIIVITFVILFVLFLPFVLTVSHYCPCGRWHENSSDF